MFNIYIHYLVYLPSNHFCHKYYTVCYSGPGSSIQISWIYLHWTVNLKFVTIHCEHFSSLHLRESLTLFLWHSFSHTIHKKFWGKCCGPESFILSEYIIYFSILLHWYITHPVASIYNATQPFIFKHHLQSSKIHKMSLKSHFFKCRNMFRPYKAILRQLLIDWNHHTASAHTSIYLHAIAAHHYLRMYVHTSFMLFSYCGVYTVLLLCVVYLSWACILEAWAYILK
jgi:hypothetical protein